MADDIIDPLKIKIETAKRQLPLETVNAIDSVDWKIAILGMRIRHGYTFEQLGDLELETELLLSGLISPEDYPKELEKRMGIPGAQVGELVNEMNDLVFKKIKEELIKNTERKKIFANKTEATEGKDEVKVLSKDIIEERALFNKDGIEIIDRPALPGDPSRSGGKEPSSENSPEIVPNNREKMLEEIEEPAHPILAQKLSTSLQIPMVKTDHSLENITKSANTDSGDTIKSQRIDPYREIPE